MDLKTAMTNAGFKKSSPAKIEPSTFKLCDCGAILSKEGTCKLCDPFVIKTTRLRKGGNVKHDTIKLICAWCDKVLRKGYEPASHGICTSCRKELLGDAGKT